VLRAAAECLWPQGLQATVSWTVPPTDDNQTIAGYRITAHNQTTGATGPLTPAAAALSAARLSEGALSRSPSSPTSTYLAPGLAGHPSGSGLGKVVATLSIPGSQRIIR
jgi:hypothetical protein